MVCKALLDMSGCKYDATYRVTSVDPPEMVRFIKDKHPDVIREVPRDKDGKPCRGEPTGQGSGEPPQIYIFMGPAPGKISGWARRRARA